MYRPFPLQESLVLGCVNSTFVASAAAWENTDLLPPLGSRHRISCYQHASYPFVVFMNCQAGCFLPFFCLREQLCIAYYASTLLPRLYPIVLFLLGNCVCVLWYKTTQILLVKQLRHSLSKYYFSCNSERRLNPCCRKAL